MCVPQFLLFFAGAESKGTVNIYIYTVSIISGCILLLGILPAFVGYIRRRRLKAEADLPHDFRSHFQHQ